MARFGPRVKIGTSCGNLLHAVYDLLNIIWTFTTARGLIVKFSFHIRELDVSQLYSNIKCFLFGARTAAANVTKKSNLEMAGTCSFSFFRSLNTMDILFKIT